jgi:hypothetical protein
MVAPSVDRVPRFRHRDAASARRSEAIHGAR